MSSQDAQEGTASKGTNDPEEESLIEESNQQAVTDVNQPLRAGNTTSQTTAPTGASGAGLGGQRYQGTPSSSSSARARGGLGAQGYRNASANQQPPSTTASNSNPTGPSTQPTEFEQALAEMSGNSGAEHLGPRFDVDSHSSPRASLPRRSNRGRRRWRWKQT